jgi:hypothetical protein
MAREIPEVVRAAAGLAATVVDEARRLPETLPGIPVRIIGLAMQQAMKVQQQYAGFVARGDELFTGLRGEDEPGLATFDDDIEPVTVTQPGFRDSAFDRATAEPTSAEPLSSADVEALPADEAADAIVAAVAELAEQVEEGQQSIEELVEASPGTADILDEIAIDELVDQAPTLEETAPATPAAEDAAGLTATLPGKKAAKRAAKKSGPAKRAAKKAAAAPEDTATPESATPESATPESATPESATPESATPDTATPDTATPDTATPDTATATADTNAGPATATDESGSDTAAEDAAIAQGAAIDAVGEASAAPTDEPRGGSELSGSQAVGAAPIDGYDSFTIAQLRGRLRGYALPTVVDLVAYEEATRARDPYLRMLRNRLEKVEAQAIESSPLAPRGA